MIFSIDYTRLDFKKRTGKKGKQNKITRSPPIWKVRNFLFENNYLTRTIDTTLYIATKIKIDQMNGDL